MVAVVHKASLSAVEHILSMGIPLLGVGQMHWNGLSFSFHSAAASATIRGDLAIGDDGRPVTVNLLDSHDRQLPGVPKEIPGKVIYTYNSNNNAGLRVASASVRDGISPQAVVFAPDYGSEDNNQIQFHICSRACAGSTSPESLASAA